MHSVLSTLQQDEGIDVLNAHTANIRVTPEQFKRVRNILQKNEVSFDVIIKDLAKYSQVKLYSIKGYFI